MIGIQKVAGREMRRKARALCVAKCDSCGIRTHANEDNGLNVAP